MSLYEDWRPVEGYETKYEVSNFGKVRSLDRVIISSAGWSAFKAGVELKPLDNGNGYLSVVLWEDNSQDRRYIHRLVIEAFVGKAPGPEYQVAHWDGDRSNNRVNNLRWATPKENAVDKARHGTDGSGKLKIECKRGHKLSDNNINQYGNGGRSCRACTLMLSYMSRRTKSTEEDYQKVSDQYYQMILSGDSIFFQPTCHRGHELKGANVGLYKKYNKRYCKSCEYARKRGKRQSLSKEEIGVLADDTYRQKMEVVDK